MRAFMEMIFIDPKTNHGLFIGVGAEDRFGVLLSMFDSYRDLNCPANEAEFILDLHDESHELVDTLYLTASGFEKITGEKAKTAEEYRKYEEEYMARARQVLRESFVP